MTVVYPPPESGGGAAVPRRTGGPVGGPTVPGSPSEDSAAVTVAGLGQALVVPDALRLELSVEATEAAVAAALGTARSTMAEVRRVVAEAGVADADQHTSGLNIWPRHDENGARTREYVATESLSVMLRRPDLVDVVLAAAADVAGDLLRVGGLGFTITDPSSAQDDARRLALAEARRRAELYASELGAVVGPLLRLVEGRADHDDGDTVALYGRRRASKSVEPGTQVVSMQVTATWALLTGRGVSAARTPDPSPAEPPGVEPAPPVDPR